MSSSFAPFAPFVSSVLALAFAVAALPAQDPGAAAPKSRAVERTLEALPKSRFFVIPPREPEAGAAKAAMDAPEGLLVVLPGGDASAEFLPFVENGIHAQLPDFCCAMVTAPKWKDDQKIVWPTAKSRTPGMEYTTEEYVRAVVADVKKARRIDEKRVLLLVWSSSGPAAYATLLGGDSPFTGAYVAMSIWPAPAAADLARAKGRRIVLDQSPEDTTTVFAHARKAHAALTKAGAVVRLSTYAGGHGWNDAPLPRLRKGLLWLLSGEPAPAPRWPDEPKVAAAKKGAAKDGKSLLANGGFESGLGDWEIIGNSATFVAEHVEKDAKEGKGCLRLAKTGGMPLDLVRQDVGELPKQGRVTARAWVKTKGAKNAFVKCFLYEGDEIVHEDVDVAHLRGDADWKQVEKTWDVAGADRAVFQIVLVLGGEVWIDGCELVAEGAKAAAGK